MSTSADAQPTGTQSIDRAAQLLVSVLETSEPPTVGELATRSGLPKSTTSRLVGALERHGLVQRAPGSGSLVPGRVLVRYARQETGEAELIAVAADALDRLAAESGETVNIGIPSAGAVEQLDQRDSRHYLGSTNWVGRRVPPHGSALGKVFLAFGAMELPPGRLEPLGPETIVDRTALARDLEAGRAAWIRGRRRGARARSLGRRRAGSRRGRLGDRGAQHLRARRCASATGSWTSSESSRSGEAGHVSDRLDLRRTKARCRMTDDQIDLRSLTDADLVAQMHDDLYDGLAEEIVEGTEILLEREWSADKVLNDALVEGMRIVGIDFRDGILFVPEVLLAANAMKAGMELLRPLLAETGAERIGKVVIGTVKGDIHDIGKNLVAMMLEGAGFEVIDLGINNPVENYLAALEEHEPDILGLSALLTTTMPYMKVVIETLKEKGIRDDYIVLVGGAPLNEDFGKAVGADAYCRDAAVAAETAQALVMARRAAATAGLTRSASSRPSAPRCSSSRAERSRARCSRSSG